MSVAKRILSFLLASLIMLSVITVSILNVYADSTNSSQVYVNISNEKGSMNLTKEGTLDWVHVAKTSDRKTVSNEGGTKPEVIDTMKLSVNSGKTFGQKADQVWRY